MQEPLTTGENWQLYAAFRQQGISTALFTPAKATGRRQPQAGKVTKKRIFLSHRVELSKRTLT